MRISENAAADSRYAPGSPTCRGSRSRTARTKSTPLLYIMPVMLEDTNLRDPLREALDRRGIQTPCCTRRSASSPRIPDTRIRLAAPVRTHLALSAHAAALNPHLGDERLERVVGAVREGLAELELAG